MEASEAAPEATVESEVIVGKTGLEPEEHQPLGGDARGTVNVRSAPPAQSQSGVPLDEDRAAGVEASEEKAPPGAPEVAATPGL